MMTWTKIKSTVAMAIAFLLIAGGGAVIALQLKAPLHDPAPAARTDPDWRPFFNSVYNLEDGQIVKRIAPPFIPERQIYYQADHMSQARSIANSPDYFTFYWENGQLKYAGLGFTNRGNNIQGILMNSFGLRTYEFDGGDELLKTPVTGDWIVRKDAPIEQQMAALLPILAEATGQKLKLEKQMVLRDVWVAKGEYMYKSHPAAKRNDELVLYVGEYKNQDGGGGGSGDFAKFLSRLGSLMTVQVIDETTGPKPERLGWMTQDSSYISRTRGILEREENMQKLLDVVSTQTNLKFSKERRNVSVWQLGLIGG